MNNADIKRTINGLHEIAKELEAIEARIQELVEQPEDEELADAHHQLEEMRSGGVDQWMEQLDSQGRNHVAKAIQSMAIDQLSFPAIEDPFDTLVFRVLRAAHLFAAYGMLTGIYDPDGDEDQTLQDLLG